MSRTARKLADLYLRRKRANILGHLSEVAELLSVTQRWLDTIRFHAETMAALKAAGERRRLGRTSGIVIKSLDVDNPNHPSHIEAVVQGTSDVYRTRITFAPRRGHRCTCPDWQRNGLRIGPCKHVLALGEHWDVRVRKALDRAEDKLIDLVQKAEF